jgi:hypothetical protein
MVHIVRKAALITLIGFTSFSALADTGSWEESRTGYSIYSSGGWTNTPFTSSSGTVPRSGAAISNISWDYNDIQNGNTYQKVELCYHKIYTRRDYKCINISEVSIGSAD